VLFPGASKSHLLREASLASIQLMNPGARVVLSLALMGATGCAALTIGVPLVAERGEEAHPHCPWRVVPTLVDSAVTGALIWAMHDNSKPPPPCPPSSSTGGGVGLAGCLSGPIISNGALVLPLTLAAASAAFGWVETGLCIGELWASETRADAAQSAGPQTN
jgi:hypothetical protein